LLNPRTRLPGLTKEAMGEIRNFVVRVRVLEGVVLIQHISTNLFVGQLYVSDSSDSPNNKMASGGWRSIKCHNCPRHPVQGRELPRSYPFPYRVPVRGLPIAAPVHFDASSRKDVLSVPASPPRLQLSVQLKRSTQDFRDGLPCTFPGSDRPFPLRMLIFLERSFHTISAISNLLCMSRHCFKGSLFCHNYLPAILPPPNSGVWLQGSYHRLLDLGSIGYVLSKSEGAWRTRGHCFTQLEARALQPISSTPSPSTFRSPNSKSSCIFLYTHRPRP
jgi:hypothetical protein